MRLDLERIRRNLSEEGKQEVSPAEVLQWLRDAGFVETPEGWAVHERDLGYLRPEEVTESRVQEAGEK